PEVRGGTEYDRQPAAHAGHSFWSTVMDRFRTVGFLVIATAIVIARPAAQSAAAQQPQQAQQTGSGQYEPRVGQPGKDVVWVPTPEEMVERMLDLGEI